MRKSATIALLLAAISAFGQVPSLGNGSQLKFLDGDNTFLRSLSDLKTFINTGVGSVTSVGLSLPAEFSVSGSPVTSTGTLGGAWASQTTNKVFASPNGSTGTPTFRALAAADIPTIGAAQVTGNNLTAASTKISVASGTGATLTNATIDVNEGNLSLNNIGGTLGITKGGTGLTALGGDGTIIGSNGTTNVYLSPTVTTAASSVAFSRSGSNLNLNLPDADASNRGTVSTSAQTFAGAKTFNGLVTAGAGAIGTATASAAAVNAQGVEDANYAVSTATATLDHSNNLVAIATLTAAVTYNLPACNATRDGWTYRFTKTGNDTFGATIDPNGAEAFSDGATTKTLYSRFNGASCTCRWDGSTGSWFYFPNL